MDVTGHSAGVQHERPSSLVRAGLSMWFGLGGGWAGGRWRVVWWGGELCLEDLSCAGTASLPEMERALG